MPRPLNFRQIEAFRAVMLAGTTTGAARMLHTTQPSISRLIGQMQAASGLKLFDMHNGRLRPTLEASELFDTIQRHFLGLESIEARIDTMRRSGSGILRVACTPSLGLGIVPAAVSLFTPRHPGVSINIQTLGSHYLRDGLLHGMFDLVLSTGGPGGNPLHETLLHRSHAVCVMHAGHALAAKGEVHARDLDGLALLSLNADDELAISVQNALAACGVAPASRIETTYSSTVCSLAMRTQGVGIVNEYAADAFAGQLAVRRFRPAIPVNIYLAHPSQRAPSRLAGAFVEILAEALERRADIAFSRAGPEK